MRPWKVICMSKYTRNPFELKRINCPLPPFYDLVLRYDGHAQDHVSFLHAALTEQNAKLAHHKIWTEFKRFARKCMRKIPPCHRYQKIAYGSSHGFPVALMPDNSEIITINHLDDESMLHFAWIVENGGDDE